MNISKSIVVCLLSIVPLSIAKISQSREQHTIDISPFPPILVLAQNDTIPKVGVLENKETGAGCSYWFVGTSAKKQIFSSGGKDSLMNLDGRDTILKKVSSKSVGRSDTSVYRTGDLKIQIDAKFADKYTDGPNAKVKIRITRNDRSKVINAIGYCGC